MLSSSLWSPITKHDSPYNHFADVVNYVHGTFQELAPLVPATLTGLLKDQGFHRIAGVCVDLLAGLTAPDAGSSAAVYFKRDVDLLLEFVRTQHEGFLSCFEPLVRSLSQVPDEVDQDEIRAALLLRAAPHPQGRKWLPKFLRKKQSASPNVSPHK